MNYQLGSEIYGIWILTIIWLPFVQGRQYKLKRAVKPVFSKHLRERQNLFKTDACLVQLSLYQNICFDIRDFDLLRQIFTYKGGLYNWFDCFLLDRGISSFRAALKGKNLLSLRANSFPLE